MSDETERKICSAVDNIADDTEDAILVAADRLDIEPDKLIDRLANELKARCR